MQGTETRKDMTRCTRLNQDLPPYKGVPHLQFMDLPDRFFRDTPVCFFSEEEILVHSRSKRHSWHLVCIRLRVCRKNCQGARTHGEGILRLVGSRGRSGRFWEQS